MLVLRKVIVIGAELLGFGGGLVAWNEICQNYSNGRRSARSKELTTGLSLEGFGDGGGWVDAGRASVQMVCTATGTGIFSVLPALELLADRRNMPDRRPLILVLLPRTSVILRSESEPCCCKESYILIPLITGTKNQPPTETSLSAPRLFVRLFNFPMRVRFFFLVPLGRSLWVEPPESLESKLESRISCP